MTAIKLEVGRHGLEIHAPDTLVLRWRGVVAPQELEAMFVEVEAHCSSWPMMLTISDHRQLVNMPPAARKLIPSLARPLPLRGGVSFGGSLVLAATGALINKMINLLSGHDNPFAHVDTEAAAHAWIVQRREVLRREKLARRA
jgi:hypothetical protein